MKRRINEMNQKKSRSNNVSMAENRSTFPKTTNEEFYNDKIFDKLSKISRRVQHRDGKKHNR